PAGIAGAGENDLLVPGQDEAWRTVAPLGAFLAHLEFGEDPPRIVRPALLLEDEIAAGRMDHAVVDFGEGFGFQQKRFRLGTPDLAAASTLVADEHQRRTPGLSRRDAGQRRCAGHHQSTHHHGPSVQHWLPSSWEIPRGHYGRRIPLAKAASPPCEASSRRA